MESASNTRLVEAVFQRCESNMCFYWKRDGENIVIIDIYVGDLLALDTNTSVVDRLFTSLASLSIKILGRVSKFFGMRVKLNDDGSYSLD